MTNENILMPRRLTAENGAKKLLSGEFHIYANDQQCPECDGFGGDCDVCFGAGEVNQELTIDWTTIKAIYAKAADYFEANPTDKTVKPE